MTPRLAPASPYSIYPLLDTLPPYPFLIVDVDALAGFRWSRLTLIMPIRTCGRIRLRVFVTRWEAMGPRRYHDVLTSVNPRGLQ